MRAVGLFAELDYPLVEEFMIGKVTPTTSADVPVGSLP